jgi:ATP-binding cassette, subfamily C (CFTR/MRP), member 1
MVISADDLGSLGLALSNMSSLSQILSDVLSAYANMENSVVSIQRINEVVCISPEETPYTSGTPNHRPTQSDGADQNEVPHWPSQGSIVFENISLRYGDDMPWVLKDISFRIQPGQRIGICGRTGWVC